MRIRVMLSEKCRKAVFAETGQRLPATYEGEVDAAALSVQARSTLATWNLDEPVELGVDWPPRASYSFDGHRVELDAVPTTVADWEQAIMLALREREANREAWEVRASQKRDEYLAAAAEYLAGGTSRPYVAVLDSHLSWIPSCKETLKPVMDEVSAEANRRQKADSERLHAEAQARRDAEAADAARREADKRSWVAEHGSEGLKRKCAAGYDCQHPYAFERARMEHPGYVVDWKDKAEWRSRSCPSDHGFNEAESVGGTVVWLTAPPMTGHGATDEDLALSFEPGEAVVIRDYLNKYDLVKML